MLTEAAVGAQSGSVSFGIEPTGKFGGIKAPYAERITVPCAAIGDVLENALSRHGLIDILKIDVEGTEEEIVVAIAPEFWPRIGTIYAENSNCAPSLPAGFQRTFRYDVERLSRGPRTGSAPPPPSR